MGEMVYLDGRDRLLTLLHETFRRVERGEAIAVAWVEVDPQANFRPGWWSTTACQLKSGNLIGGVLLRAAVDTLANEIDKQATEGCAESADDGGNPDKAS